ncbi:MAG: hypothetical protein CVU65_18565, partial [Deltaproteobacteria bacterium HGW-Deltaproteobacteria-22]
MRIVAVSPSTTCEGLMVILAVVGAGGGGASHPSSENTVDVPGVSASGPMHPASIPMQATNHNHLKVVMLDSCFS